MNILKKIFFPIFSLFLFYRSIELIRNLISSEPYEYSTLEILIISFLLNLFITGIFAFMGFAYPTSKILPNSYYKIKKPRYLKFLYKLLGIKYFRVFLLLIFWGRRNNRQKYFDGTKKGLNNFVFQTKQSEFGHLGAFLMILFCSIILFVYRHFYLILIVTILNILGNIYPIVLQRFHRMRIEKITNYHMR